MSHDPQRERVYRAQERVDQGAQLYAPHQLRRYVRSIVTSAWWRSHGWPTDVKVRVTPAALNPTTASGGYRVGSGYHVTFPGFASAAIETQVSRRLHLGAPIEAAAWPWAWQELTVCHELAHVSLIADDVEPDHGPGFASRYADLACSVLGRYHALDLLREFRAERVKVDEAAAVVASPHALSASALDAAGWRPYVPRVEDVPALHSVAQGVLL